MTTRCVVDEQDALVRFTGAADEVPDFEADAIARVRTHDNADLESFALAMGDLGVTATGFDDVCGRVADRFAEVSGRFA